MAAVAANGARASVFLLFNLALGAYILGTLTLLVVKADERTGRCAGLIRGPAEGGCVLAPGAGCAARCGRAPVPHLPDHPSSPLALLNNPLPLDLGTATCPPTSRPTAR